MSTAPKTAPKWTAMSARQFDTAATDTPLALFALPDPCGTPDLFSEAEQAPVWVRVCTHPRCVLTVAHGHGVR